MHGEEESHEPEVVVSVQVTDEDVIYFMIRNLEPHQLHLSAFATVDQEVTVLNIDVLGGWKAT